MTAPVNLPYDLEEVRALLDKAGLSKGDDAVTLVPYDPAFPRRPQHRRYHYRVDGAEQTVCHLVVGMNLEPVKTQAEKFSRVCPPLICRPLAFWERADGIGLLCLEHFNGESLEALVQEGRCDADEWLRVVRKAQHLLESSEILSNRAALLVEIEGLATSLSAFPEFSIVDVQLVRELAVSLLLKQAAFNPLTTRWSNGDFIGRNLLVNAKGDIRLIDYEHARPTHFWRSDWRRLTQFSQLPANLDGDKIEENLRIHEPWQKVHFWLHNLSQLSEAESCDPVDRHIRSVVCELFKAIDLAARSAATPEESSFLVTALAKVDAGRASFSITPRDERYRQRRLEENLEQANYRLLSVTRELVQKKAVIRDQAGSLKNIKAAASSLASESSHRRASLEQAQCYIDHFLSQNPVSQIGAEELYSVDQKGRWFANGGQLTLSGWIKGTSPELKVRLHFDSGNTFDCVINKRPPPVAGSSGNQTVDFSVETYVPAGLHLATLEYCAISSPAWIPLCTRSLVAEISPLLLRLETAIPPVSQHRDHLIQGWCFHPQEKIRSLSASRGLATSDLTHGIARPDVGSSYAWSNQSLSSGFSGSIELLPGDDDVVLSVSLENGAILREIIARRILVQDDALTRANEALSRRPLDTGIADSLPFCRLNEILRFGKEDTIRPFLDFGWHEPENGLRWAVGPRAGLRFRFNSAERPSSMKITVIPLIVAMKAERQRIQIILPYNTEPETLELTSAPTQEFTLHFQVLDFESNVLTVQFGFPDAARPHDLGLSNDIRLLSVAFVKLVFA